MKSDIPERTFNFAKDVVILCRKITSIGANIEEGQASQSRADFIHKYSISCKEARETLYWIKILEETEMIDKSELVNVKQECNELVAILTTIIKNSKKGLK